MESGYIYIGVASPGNLDIVSNKEAVLKCDIQVKRFPVVGRDTRHFYIEDEHAATIPFRQEQSGKDLQPDEMQTVTWMHDHDTPVAEETLRKHLTKLHNEKMSRLTLRVRPEKPLLKA